MKKGVVMGLFVMVLAASCNLFEVKQVDSGGMTIKDSVMDVDTADMRDSVPDDGTRNMDTALLPPAQTINTANVQPNDVVSFAETLIGVPYLYASTNPEKGFDCSGFITYVFNHFKIAVPRSSVDFTNVGKTIPVAEAKRGDLILFTGTDSTERVVGHMGLIIANDKNGLQFIHSSSGKAYGVTVTPLNDYYQSRFVKTIRIFPQNNN